ncbi:hypothetical protein B0H17DRAFT_1137361 [Mycena rosella]|uniref:Uncharacterized protein n=1 Tax=Mycena rosella TaxID=1033263 RepID=A0AAD7D902_MYCRO|nr:hypothetical protein B0H17DRAFT_1137361 [Mycena rosella]
MPPRPSTGPPQALIERIDYLQSLINHLPTTLPLDPPESLYQLYLDEDCVTDCGTVFPVVGHALELSFETWKRASVLRFKERGSRLNALGPFLKMVVKRMTPSEHVAFETSWIDRLLQAAKDSGAAIPSAAAQRKAKDTPRKAKPTY